MVRIRRSCSCGRTSVCSSRNSTESSSATSFVLPLSRPHSKLADDCSRQVSANGKGFLRGLCYWFLLAIPSVYTNAMIRFLQSKLSISFRTRLTRYVHDLYLDKNATFYKVVNLDSRIGASGADQFVRGRHPLVASVGC